MQRRETPVDAAMPALAHEARPMAGDAERLLAALARGDPEAFRQVMELEFDSLYLVAWGILGSRDDAEDACQEVFLRLYRAASKLSADTSLRAWLRRVCVNYCLDEQRRRRRRRPTAIDELDDLPVPDQPSHQEAEQAELRRAVRRALAQLPPGQRAVFVLRHFQECSVKETGQILGCAEGTVKAHLSRAVRRLRELLKGWGPEPAEMRTHD